MAKPRVAIVGGGIGGLATAALLARKGYSVDVYEAREQLGGRAGLLERDGYRFDTGPSWYLMADVFERFYQSLGTSAERELDLVRLSPSYRVFYEHQPSVVITGDIEADAATFEAIEPGAGAALRRYAARSQKLYDLAVRHFLYTDFSDLRRLVRGSIMKGLPQLLSLLTTPIHRYVSRYVRDQRLQSILEYPMVFLGTSPFRAPALYSLMSALDFAEGVSYPRGGLYTIIGSIVRLGKARGVSYHTGVPVRRIVTAHGRATGVELMNGTQHAADIVISNADLHHTETSLLAAEDRSYPERYWRRRDPGMSALLVYCGVRGAVPELEHHNLFFVDEWKHNFEAIYEDRVVPEHASLYVCKPSASDPTVAPAGHENVFVLLPLPVDLVLDTADQDALVRRCLAQIETMADVPGLRSRIDVKAVFGPHEFGSEFHSWRSSALGPAHVLKQSALWRTGIASKKVAGLYYVGAGTMPGIGLPMCLISAEIVTQRILRDRSKTT